METNKYIFISSSSRDKPLAEKIASELESMLSVSVWMDSKNLMPGSKWEDELDKALRNSAVVLTLLSNNYLSSKWFLSQSQLALSLNIPLIPVVIDPDLKISDTPDFIQKLRYVFYPDQQDELYEAIIIYLKLDRTKLPKNKQTATTSTRNVEKRKEESGPTLPGSLLSPENLDDDPGSSNRRRNKNKQSRPTRTSPPPNASIANGEDKTPFHKDTPSQSDYLGRKGFVEALAEWIDRYWTEYQNTDKSFITNIHGQWGAGKTTFLNLLQKELQSKARNDWIVVWFNAWENRHIKPEWWPLMDKIYRDYVVQLKVNEASKDEFEEKRSVWLIEFREWWWRFYSGRKWELFGFIASAVLLVFVFYWVMSTGFFPDQDFMTRVEGVVKSIGLVFSAVSTIFLGTKFVSQTLTSGSAKAAEVYLQLTPDPIENIKRHFNDLVEKKINKPVIVFIDDLDRCDRVYLVNLLESIQTVLNHRKVFYVVAADQRWLFAAFEETYKDFKNSVKEPGKKIGYLFLEKIFQLSVSIPNISDEAREVYLDYLLGREKKGQLEARREQARKQVEKIGSEQALINEVGSQESGSIEKVFIREAAVAKSASLAIEKETVHFLSNFAKLMDPNPRSIKRFVTFYGVLRAMAILSDESIVSNLKKRSQLALWTIVKMRWPLLADYLEEYPMYLENFKSGRSKKAIHPDVIDLVKDEEVKAVLKGNDINVELDEEALRQFISLKATERTF